MNQGDVYWVDFLSKNIGHEFKGRRPAIIIESNSQIRKTNIITIMPLTSNLANKLEDDILVNKNQKNRLLCNSVVKVYYIMSFDKSRFVKKIGRVDNLIIKKINQYLIKHFGI